MPKYLGKQYSELTYVMEVEKEYALRKLAGMFKNNFDLQTKLGILWAITVNFGISLFDAHSKYKPYIDENNELLMYYMIFKDVSEYFPHLTYGKVLLVIRQLQDIFNLSTLSTFNEDLYDAIWQCK